MRRGSSKLQTHSFFVLCSSFHTQTKLKGTAPECNIRHHSTHNTMTNTSSDDAAPSILTSLIESDPETNSFACFAFPLLRQEPSVVRKKFLALSLQVHPDKNAHPAAKEAFQKLSQAFEILYDANEQAKHLEQILVQQQQQQQQQAKQKQQQAKKRQKSINVQSDMTNFFNF